MIPSSYSLEFQECVDILSEKSTLTCFLIVLVDLIFVYFLNFEYFVSFCYC